MVIGPPEKDLASDADKYQRARDIWYDHNHRQEFEHQLIDRKTTWLLTTQAILFAAYGVTFQSGAAESAATAEKLDEFRDVLSFCGVAVAGLLFISVLALLNSKFLSWRRYERFYKKPDVRLPEPHDRLRWGVCTPNTVVAVLPEVLLPIVFIVAWVGL